VKVGEWDATAVVVVHAVPRIDHLKTAIKLKLKNRFSTVDEDEIIIRDPISGEAIPSTVLLNLNSTDATVTVLGSDENPFIVDAPPQGIFTLTCYLSMNYLLAQALHLLCVESYVLMCPFYYSNYQSILFCVESVIKFLSHNDVCVCLSIVLYLLIPHSYNPHLTSYLILRIC
jgi:hypothetical protein